MKAIFHPVVKSKLSGYRKFVTELLKDAPFLSSPQVLDRLKEHDPELPSVSDRTVYNFVEAVRLAEGLPKSVEHFRKMSQVPPLEYGKQAQVDFGEKCMKDSSGRQVKVYFFAMVLSRSRYKFIYFQNIPFNSHTTVYAHHLTFRFFSGYPLEIVYDQDRKLLVPENKGDYLMTAEFAAFQLQVGFKPLFCFPSDPQSKGKIENVIHYVKGNFLKGRTYRNISLLNEEAIGWLHRTGNGKTHGTIRLTCY